MLLLATPWATTDRTMRAVRKVGAGCGKETEFSCVKLENVSVPSPGFGKLLIEVAASGVNPDEIGILSHPAVDYTLGWDVSGVVVAKGVGCSDRVAVGDRVWASNIGATGPIGGPLEHLSAREFGGLAGYAVRDERFTGVLPPVIDIVAAGTLPVVAMTALGALRAAGAPWAAAKNATVLVTAGAGGTGYIAVQLAAALGAARVVTAASGAHLNFVRSLLRPQDVVVDYAEASVFDAVADRSVAAVVSNHESNHSARDAMRTLSRDGGVYVTIDGDTLPTTPPAGVRQAYYRLLDPSEAVRCVEYLDQLAALLADGSVRAAVQEKFGLEQAAVAFRLMAQGHVASKLAIVPGMSMGSEDRASSPNAQT